MAFNLKKRNARDEADGIQNVDEGNLSTYLGGEPSNVVATQSWVFNALKRFWKWTKFFATESLQVAGGINSERVNTGELQTNNIYATRLNLVDPHGRAMTIRVNEAGELVKEYDFQNVFVYPGAGDGAVKMKNYVYRYDKKRRMADNFIGLTPYETLLNFIPFHSQVTATVNDVVCPLICPADGQEKLVDWTLLFQCPSSHKITKLEIWDKDLMLKREIPVEGTDVRNLTINMPAFKKIGEDEEVLHVALPIRGGDGQTKPFIPPFLLPPKPPCMPHPPCPDIFNDEQCFPVDEDDLFNDDNAEEATIPQGGYEVVFENYVEESHTNIILKNSDFAQNQKQFLHVKTEAV